MNEDRDTLSEADIQRILEKVGPLEQPPAEMAARVRANVREAWQQEAEQYQSVHRFSVPAWFGAAAAISLVAVMLIIGTGRNDQDVNPVAMIDAGASGLLISEDGINWTAMKGRNIPAGTYLKSGKTASLTLASEMNTRLNADTRVQVLNTSVVRLLEGSIYADSYQHIGSVPFVIETAFGQATDIGTQFMVSAGADSWTVQVREGQVDLRDNSFTTSVMPGEQIRIAENDEVSRSSISAHDASWQWTETARPVFNIQDRPVHEYLQWVGRETGREIRYASSKARESAYTTRLGGTSISSYTASESLHFVLPTTDLKLIENGESVIIVDLTD